ncbi:MAG: ArsR family transcriptional regulator [archaeon]|nr:ArsR family transcriptional regulator [archaeon]
MQKTTSSSDSNLKIVELLKVIADPTRINIIEFLKGGEKTATEIQVAMEKLQPVISQHLKLLVNNGDILKFRTEGKLKYFSIKDMDIFDILTEIYSLVPESNDVAIAKYLKIYADLTRFTILKFLLDKGENSTPTIKNVVGKHESTISQQLKLLIKENLIKARTEGNKKYYLIADSQIQNLLNSVTGFIRNRENENSEKIVVLGLFSSGKTSIMRSLRGDRNLLDYYDIEPTRGVDVTDFVRQKTHYYLWECGGQEAYRDDHLLKLGGYVNSGIDKLIYVIDIQAKDLYKLVLQYLTEIISRLNDVAEEEFEFHIFLHKFDPGLELEPEYSEIVLQAELISKIRKIMSNKYNFRLFKTSIYTVFRTNEMF